MQKQAKNLKIDANSSAFQEIIRYVWIPRLLQKIEGSSTSSSPSSSLSTYPTVSDQPVNCSAPDLPPPPPPQQEVSGHHQGHVDHNSDSEHGSNSCISSTESMNCSQISELSEYPASPFHSMCTFQKDSFYVDNLDTMTLATLSVTEGGFQNSTCEPHVSESNWVEYDFGDNMWNMDEFMAI